MVPPGAGHPAATILVLYAHPYPGNSRACRALVEGIRTVPQVAVRPLYDLYPDFDIDIAAEQQALGAARLVVLLHPFYWYSMPSLLKHWIDMVLQQGWAYGRGGDALAGKHCLWVPTVGGDESSYAPGQTYLKPFERYVDPIEQTARFCGMAWEPPHVVFGARTISDEALGRHAAVLRGRLADFAASVGFAAPAVPAATVAHAASADLAAPNTTAVPTAPVAGESAS